MGHDAAPDLNTLLRHLPDAHMPTLLMTVAHLSGDPTLLRGEWRPDTSVGLTDGGYSADVRATVVALCAERLSRLDWIGFRPTPPSYDALLAAGRWIMGDVIDPYAPILSERLLFGGDDPQRPRWSKAAIDGRRDFRVAIVGAGESGLLMAYRLRQAGIPYVLFDRNAGVGGTWWTNRYPGARVDVNSFVYSYSFAPRVWSSYFAPRDEILDYLDTFAAEQDLKHDIRLETEVLRCAWDEARSLWELTVADAQGERIETANVVISAVGQLGIPKLPHIPGLEAFAGPAFHSAAWPDDLDLAGKRIGVIGNGASAMQFIPELAKVAGHVTAFTRTPTWLLPRPLLHEPVEGAERWLMEHLPHYADWYRAYEFIPQIVGFLELAEVDPAYPPSELAVSPANEAFRKVMATYIERQIVDRPDLKPHVFPDTPFASKRFVCDNGSWIAALKRDNVAVVTSPINRLDAQSLHCADGSAHPVDVLVYGTGFEASKFLLPMDVVGRGGIRLHDVWKDDARAYLGIALADMPNFFCTYGPNSNFLVHGASIFHLSESAGAYIMEAIRLLLQARAASLCVKPHVHDAYNRRVDVANANKAWGFSRVSSWYKNSAGRVTQNYPFSMVEFHQRTHQLNPNDFDMAAA